MKNDDDTLRALLESCRVVAVVGLSDDPQRPSHSVASYLQKQGYQIVPVNPRAGRILGEPCFAALEDIPFPVDLVNVFRRTEEVLPIARSAIAIGAKGLWQQLGVVSIEADVLACAARLWSVMDRCIKVDHRRLLGTGPSDTHQP